jgi:transcription factor E2F3
MRKGIQPALEQYLVTTGGGEGAAVVAAAAAASMDKRALLASPGIAAAAAAAPGAYIQTLTRNTSTISCSSSLQSGALSASSLLPCVPGVEPSAGSLLYTTPQGPSSRARLLQQPHQRLDAAAAVAALQQSEGWGWVKAATSTSQMV